MDVYHHNRFISNRVKTLTGNSLIRVSKPFEYWIAANTYSNIVTKTRIKYAP
jgi:hypothetical protein